VRPAFLDTIYESISRDGQWAEAAAKENVFAKGLSIDEKVNLITGVDTVGRYVPSGTIIRALILITFT
jgi:hypothetical protein